MNNLNNVSVYSIASDILTLRQGYYGAFDVCGELHVSQIARFDERVFAKDLTVIDDICANRLLVEGATVHHANVSIYGNLLVDQGNVQFTKNMDVRGTARVGNVFYVGDSGTAFLYGTPTIGNIGVNQSVPMAGWDMSSAVPFAFHVKAPRSDTVSGAFETGNGHAVGIRATSSTAQIEFSVETPFSQTSTAADARIQYASGGILTIDVSDNTNVRSRMAVNPRFTTETNTPSHLWKETVSVYDDAAVNSEQYLPNVYDNENARTANALTLVAADNTDNTFLHWSTPDKRGLAIGGGAYVSGARSMGAFGLTDSCGQFVPSMNLVSGNSHTHNKSCWGVNTHAPKVDDYVVDINGPLHINNGELTVLKTTEFEVVGFQNGKTNTGFVVAVGSPRTSQAPFKQQILYTKDEGKTWTQYLLDFTGTVLETNGVLLKDVCVVDSSFALVVGEQGLVLYSFPDESVWPGITLPFEIQFDDILSVYVRPETNRAFFGLTGAIFWADLGTQVYTDANGFGIVSSFTQGTLSLTGTGLRSVRGFQETLWAIQGTKILKFINIDTPTPTQQWFYSRTSQIVYTTLHVLDNHHVCALAGNTITFSHNASASTVLGAQWTNVGVDGPFAVLNSVCLLDASNAVVVGNNGLIYFSNDGYHSWNPIPYSQLNTSGNADRLLDERYNLTNISCEDNINFFITQTTKNFNATTRNSGETRVFQIYLPNLFESKNNYVMDVSGCVHLSGDLKINDGGSIISEEPVFHVLDTQVDTVYVGGETTNITMGSSQGNVYLRGGLDVQGATVFGGNVRIQRQLSVGGNTSLEGNLEVLSAVTVAGNTFLQQDVTVDGNTTLQGNSVVNGILFAAGDYAVVEQDLFVNRDATVTGETDLSGNAWVRGNLTVESVLDVSDVVIARNDVVVLSDISLNQNMFVGEAIYSNFYDGLAGSVFSTPDIYIGGKNIMGYSSRNIRIGNFNTTVDTSNVIYLGGKKDQVIIEGSIQQSSNLEAGPVIYLNATALPSSSAGAGIHIGDDGNKDAGYIVISNDLKGFILQPTNPNNLNALKLNVMDTTLPTNFTTGLLALNRAPNTVLDADYEITTSVLDPSNLLLKNKLLATTAGHQVVDSSFSVTGRMSVGTTSTDSNAALVVNGNLQQLSGHQWQFTSSWPAQPDTSNRWKQSYVQGFVDISGGPLILRNSDASFNGNLSLQQNFVYSGVVVQKTATVSSVVFSVTTPVYNTYNIATTTNTVITLPNIDANNLRGAIINFVKTANAGILVTFQSDGNANGFVANGGTASAASFAFLPAKTSMAFLAGETGNWIEVGFSIGTDLSITGNISAGTNLTVVNGNLTVSSGRTNLRDTTITGNVTVTQNTTLSGADVTIAGNVTTQGNTRVYGGFYPYQPAVAAAPTATGIFIGDSGRFRQAISTNNVSIGPRALEGNTTVNGLATNTGVNNVAIGSLALNTLSSGSLQTAVGVSAGEKSQFGTQNVFLGASAGSLGFRTSASTNNVVVGFAAGSTADVEYANVSLLGASTLDNHTATSVTGTSAVGAYAGQGASVLNYSTLVGTLAGQNMAAEYATSVGYLAGQASTSSWSTAVGAQAGKNAGLYSTFLGSRSATVGGSFTNVTAVGYGANAVADYEFVVGGDDGNSSGLLPLLTLPNKMKIGGVQVISSSTTLSFRSEENVVVTTGGINLTLPTPNATRTALNVGARFHVQKTFTGTLNVVAPAGQTILYLGSSFSTLVSPSTEYHMTLLCVGTTGNTWLALNVQGVDLKSAQTIQGIKTFSSTPVFSAGATVNGTLNVNGTVAFLDMSAINVTASGNLTSQGLSTLNTISASGNVAVGGNLSVTNAATLQANATVNGNLSVAGTTQLTGVVTTSGNLNCSGNLSVSRQLTVSGITATQDITATNLNLSGNVSIGGNIANSTLSTRGNLQVAGWTTVTGDLSANNLFTSAQGNLTVGGLSTLANVQLSGNLTVNGFTQLQEVTAVGNANVSGNVNITRNLFVQSGSSATITGNLTAGNILTQGVLTVSGGFYPYQPTVASSTLRDTSIYVGDTGIHRTGTAQRNVAIGGGALRGSTSVPANNTGRDNVAIGWSAQENATGASAQIAIGSSAGRQALNAAQNVLIGNTCAAAGLQTNASVNNVVIGDSAMSTTTTDFANTCVVGAGAFVSASVSGTTTGTTSVGALAGASFLTANNSTIVGFQAGQSISSNNATMVGFQAGQNSLNHNFTAIGNSAGKSAGTNSTYIGSNTGGTFTNSTAVGFNAQTTADYEVVLGGDDGNASGNMPLLTLPNKMKLAGVRTFASGTLATLEFRFPENIVLTNSSITIVTLPTPDGTRANLNLGARFRLQKTFSGAVTVNAPAGQTISYNGASASSYTFQANEYYVTFLCIANTGTTWLALNAQGVDLKSAQTIGGGDKTFTANLIATNTSSTFNGSVSCTNGVAVTGNLATTGNVSLTGNLTVGLNATVSGNVSLQGNVVVPPSTSSTFQLGNVTLSRSSAAIAATGSITAPYFQSYYINCTSDITLSLPDITSAKFAGSEIAFYKDPLAASFVVTLNASANDAVVAFGASVTTSSYSMSAGKTFVRFVANNNKWFETGGGSGGGVSPTDALTVASLTTTSTGASISGTYPTTSYTLNVNGPMLAVSFNASSDRRLKTNIQSLTSQWDVIQAIEPVSFAWKSNGKQEYGFIAQQVYNVLPEMRPNMVGKHPLSNPDEPLDMSGNPLFYGLDYSRMTPFLWQGMRELMNRVQELEETVRQLQNERSPL